MKSEINPVISLIEAQVKELVFLDRIPDRKSLNKTKLNEIVEKLGIKMITPSIVVEVIGNFAFDEVLDKTKHDDPASQGQKKFSELPNVISYDVANKTYSLLSKIPQEYTFIFKFPKINKPFTKINFDYGIDLFILDEANIIDYVTEASERKLLSDLFTNIRRGRSSLEKGDAVLTVRGKGYVGKYGTIKINVREDPLYTFKVIIGIYASLDIIHRKKDADYLQPFSAYSYDIYNSEKELIRTVGESTDDAEYLHNLEFDETKLELSELDNLLKRKVTEFEYANTVIKNILTPIKLDGNKTDDKIVRKQLMIKNAAYWFYESLKISQDHIRAVYITTAFDSLLNAKGKEDTKEYKAAMVANVIAKDVLEGDSIIQSICKLYSLRNEIVHGEKAVSSIEKYDDSLENSSESVSLLGLWYLTRFLSNRIHYVNGGLSKFKGLLTLPKKPTMKLAKKTK